MADFAQLRAAVRTAREAGDADGVIAAGAQVWRDAPDRDGWDAWSLAQALRKAGRPAEAMTIAWGGLELIKGDTRAIGQVGERLASLFGWSCYNAELQRVERPRPARIEKVARTVVTAWDEFTDRAPWRKDFCPVPIVLNRAMTLLKESESWSLLAHLASITDGDRLPDEAFQADPGGSKGVPWSSAERWYVAAARAYLEEDRHVDTLRLVDQAIARHDPLGLHCTRWLYYYGAKSGIQVNDASRAVELAAMAQAAGIRDWWMGVVVADAHALAGEGAAASEDLADAFILADARGVPPEFLCSALDSATRILRVNEPEMAAQCARIQRGLREARGWRIPDALEAASGGRSEPEESLKGLIDEWRRIRRNTQTRSTGTITNVINEGSGFLIDNEGGVSRYFSYPRGRQLPEWCVAGTAVSFRALQRLDRKYGLEKPAAEDLEPLT